MVPLKTICKRSAKIRKSEIYRFERVGAASSAELPDPGLVSP
jgi:hypothetical protein